ncbi:unnamed protein product [Thelazia callipaeda]|uniref:UBR-type domain-containing protein n=1 Tax=Thelazia callipaeda TaxID=103827 RepID=A0A0N5CJP4_THECL|nr:unnamed protein product [Thelazia callipaeda]
MSKNEEAKMTWCIAGDFREEPKHLTSLFLYVINEGSSMSWDEIILSVHVIGTNLNKLTNNNVLFASKAYRVLIKHFIKYLEKGHIDANHLVDIICCLLTGKPLPDEYYNHLCSQPCNQKGHDKAHVSQQCAEMYISAKDIMTINGLLFFSSFPIEKLLSALLPTKFLDPFRSAVIHRSFCVCSPINYKDLSTIQKGITDVEKVLCFNFGVVTEAVMEYISRTSNALILMISTLACNDTIEEVHTDSASACSSAVINIHKRVSDLAVGTICSKNHLTNSTEVFTFCIGELLKHCKMDIAYVFANRFFNIIPTALSFLAFVPSSLYEVLWVVAKESLQHALKLGDVTSLKKSASTDSSDDPAAGVGDWLENILRAVPVLMDQQEDALNVHKTSIFTMSSPTNTSNVWTGSSFSCYRELCAASGGDHGYCVTEDINALLISLLEYALVKNYLDENDKMRLLDVMLYFPRGKESDIMTSDPFCLKIVSVIVFGRENTSEIVDHILCSINAETTNGTPEHSIFWLLECVAELLSIEELKKAAGSALQMLYSMLKSNSDRKKVFYMLQGVHILLVGGQSYGEAEAVMEKFRKCSCDFFDLTKTPKWEGAKLTCSMINFKHWDELHDLYVSWLHVSQWNELHLPDHIILPPTLSFLSRILDTTAITAAERCYFVCIRPLLLNNIYLTYLQKFHEGIKNIDVNQLLEISTLVNVGFPIVDDCLLVDLVKLPLQYYNSLLIFYNHLRKYHCSVDELMRLTEFVSSMYKNAINVMCERSKITISVGACATSLSIAKNDILNAAVSHARGELYSILNDDLIKIVRTWAGVMVPEIKLSCTPAMLDAVSDTFQMPTSVLAKVKDVKKQMFSALCSLSDNTVRFVLNQFLSRSAVARHDEARLFLDWMIFIYSSELTGTASRELCHSVLSRLNAVVVTGYHLARVVSTLLGGVLAHQSASETNLLNGQSVFCSVLMHLISAQNTSNLSWNTLPEDIFSSVLENIANDDSLVKRSVPLVNLLSMICYLKNVHLISRFVAPLTNHQDIFVRWVNFSAVPLETFCALQPLIEYLSIDRHRKIDFVDLQFRIILEEMMDIIFGLNSYRQMANHSLLEVKRSDRWSYASLSWRKLNKQIETEVAKSENRKYSQLKQIDVFSKALLSVLNLGGPVMHCRLIELCSRLFSELLSVIRLDGLELLMGSSNVSDTEIAAVLHAFIFLCSILDYIGGLCLALCPPSAVNDDWDDISAVFTPKHIIKKKNICSRTRVLPLCTFAATANQFIQQHWYNCYTCNIVEGEGVCSVCAVNCHRGHDLSYSKFGSFFCDCGAKGCPALKSVSYPQPRRVSSQKYAAFPSSRSKTSNHKLGVFSHLLIMEQDKMEIEKRLCQFMDMVTANKEDIVALITAVKKGVCMRSINAREKRLRESSSKLYQSLNIATDRIIMEPLTLQSKAVIDKRDEGGKSFQDIISLLEIGGTILLVTVQENSKIVLLSIRSMLNPSAKDLDIPRIELDAVNFKITAIAGKKDLLAVCCSTQCLILRINKEGDISEKHNLYFNNLFPTYAVPKIKWIDNSNMIAIAALQFIRIYDLNAACDPYFFEFVLPLGDVCEVAFVKRNDGLVIVIVLSSIGHLYVEELEKARSADGGSYFMTATLLLPATSFAISMHYSSETQFLFVSMESDTYALHFNGTEFEEASSIPVEFPLRHWCECAGVFAALSHPTFGTSVFLYPVGNVLYVQKTTLPSPATAQCMMLGADCVSQMLVQIVENQNLQVFQSNWLMDPDFWVKDVERSMQETELRPCNIVDETPESDAVTIFEECCPLQKVEFYSRALELVYDSGELTKRIVSSGMSVVCLKQKEFDIVVKNQDWNYIICALRIELTPEKCPTSVTIFGKKIDLQTKVSRMFDIRLTRKQSINCNNEVVLNFSCNSVPAQVWSVKVFGKSKKDFGFPTASFRFDQVITLPEQFIASFFSTCCLINSYMKQEGRDWILPVALSFSAPDFEHPTVSHRALILLKELSPIGSSALEQKDAFLFTSLINHRDNGTLQLSIFNAFAAQIKAIILNRIVSFHQNISKHFGDVIPFLKMCVSCVLSNSLAAEAVLEVFLLAAFVYLAVGTKCCTEITQLILRILFSDDIVIAHRCKCLISATISSYCIASVQNHSKLFSFIGNVSPTILTHKNTITSDGQVDSMSHISNSGFLPTIVRELEVHLNKDNGIAVRRKPLSDLEDFSKEMDWVGQLLLAFIYRLDDCHYDGMRCLAPAQTILFLIGQHAPDQLTDLVDFLINGLDFTEIQVERTVKGERDQIILRLIYVILVQCTSHNWPSTGTKEVVKNEAGDGIQYLSAQKTDRAKQSFIELNFQLRTLKLSTHDVQMRTNDSIDEGDEAETGGVSDVEQIEPAGDASSSSRDATPQQEDIDMNMTNSTIGLYENNTQDLSLSPEPQVVLAFRIARTLVSMGAVNYCYVLLESLKKQWAKKEQCYGQDIQKLSTVLPELQPDLAPLFNARILNANSENIFSMYTTLLIEIALRLPYQLKKVLGNELHLNSKWKNLLCDYITQEPSTMRRLARKLLVLICNSDTIKYRQVRDEHIINDLLANLRIRLIDRSSIEYFELCDIVCRINGIAVIAGKHCIVWQKICLKELPWLMELACMMPDVVCSAVLNLILLAIRTSDCSDDGLLCCFLVDLLLSKQKPFVLLKRLISRFLLGENEERRWIMHAILRATLQLASRPNQLQLISYLYERIWPLAQQIGNRAMQLVDLLSCYLPRFLSKDELIAVYKEAVKTIDSALCILETSRDSIVFKKLQQSIGTLDISVLSKSPCLICSDSNRPMEQLKLSAIKLDSRFTTSAQMIKLMGHFEVLRITIRFSEIKRSKMVKRFKFYCCNKELESAVDLKNRPELWEKAADVEVNQGDTEIDVQLPIPVATCNIVLEMAEFYDTTTTESSDAPEFVHCPRCSTSVAPNPGICSNCGENVFQCVKCRAINYDEKEPFLCNSCGFCKYARLEVFLIGRSLPSVQTIEDDNDRKAANTRIDTLLNDIELTRCQVGIITVLMEKCSWDSEPSIRPNMLLKHMSRQAFAQFMSSLNLKEGYNLATLYRSAEKLHDKLCEQIRQLAASRAELRRFDIENGDEILSDTFFNSDLQSSFDRCIGCTSALIVHCVALIQAACSDANAMAEIITEDFIFGRLVAGCALGEPISCSVHCLIWNLAEVSKDAAQKMCELVEDGSLPCYLLTKSIFENNFRFWEQKLRCLVRMAVKGNGNSEIDLHTLAAFLKICYPNSVDLRVKRHIATESSSIETSGMDSISCNENVVDQKAVDANASENTKQEFTLDCSFVPKTIDSTKLSDEEKPDFDRLTVPSEHFPTFQWLTEKFIWAEYAELLSKDNLRTKQSTEYMKRCLLNDSEEQFSLYQWLTQCMFSSVAAIRTASCRLLLMLCFEINDSGIAHVGSPIDTAQVLQKILLWMKQIRDVPADHVDEYFCLVQTILAVPEIRAVLVSEPFEFHVEIMKRILLESLDTRFKEIRGPPGDLSVGILLHRLTQVLNLLIPMNEFGWNLLCQSSPVILPLLLRASCALECVTIHRTFYVNQSAQELSVLLMRIALKRPKLVLKETTCRIKAHANVLRVQAYLISVISDVIYPLLKKEEDFLIQIEKDPRQEDYLQGRMLGNPYKSSDAGLGPLMRDIKNKICRDCELVALLDDDTGMELLVNQQIVALDLSVLDVHEKLWRDDHPNQPMVIVYRMRGLLGDATEPFIKTLNDSETKEKIDDSQLRLATALGTEICAFDTILRVLDNIELTGGGLALLRELHRLLTYCIKVKENRQQLNRHGGIRRFLHVFEVAYRTGIKEESVETVALQYLELSRILLVDVLATDQIEKSIGGASFEQMSWLLELSVDSSEKLSSSLVGAVTSIAPNLCLGNAESMDALVQTFRPCCCWNEIGLKISKEKYIVNVLFRFEDNNREFREQVTRKMETLCKITDAIHDSASGRILKKKMMDAGLITDACQYLAENHPPIFNVSVSGPEWKHFLSKPSLKYVLKLMAGMARAHIPSQEAIAQNSLPILHRLEQISSAEHIGTLAENVMEELKKNEEVAVQIEKVRQETKLKKRQMAMAMRQKQLSKLGMEIGKKGQVKVSSRKLMNEPHTVDCAPEIGVCCICREAMDSAGKIMMVYAFASRLNLRENKVICGRSHSFTTVSQMNLVHLDCHSTAVRMAGSRGEWASAALHNANTKCNIIVPIWSKQVKDSDMEHSFQRLSKDLESAVDCEAVNLDTLTLDITELLERFVRFRSFSALSHGGGRESNMQYLAVLVLLVQYLKKVSPATEPGEAHTFCHQIIISLAMDDAEGWNNKKMILLKTLQDSDRPWDDIKPELLAWTTVDYYQNNIFKSKADNRAQYMRENIIKILDACSRFVTYFDSELSRCGNLSELMKAIGIDVPASSE